LRHAPNPGCRDAILELLEATGRPMKARDIVTALAGKWPQNSVFGWLSQMRNVGDLRRDVPGGPYRARQMAP
jgi:hypothetical protein